MANLFLDWGLFGSYGTVLNGTNTVDTGGVAVTVDVTAQDESAIGVTFNGDSYVGAGEPFSANSGLKLFGEGGEGGQDDTLTTVISFAPADPMFGDTVQNVEFRVNDIDVSTLSGVDGAEGGSTFGDVLGIRAFDASGSPVPISFTLGTDVSEAGGVLTGSDTSTITDPTNSVLVSITGPISRVEFDYDNTGDSTQLVWVSDLHFETVDTDGGNGDPVANDDSASTDADMAVVIPVLANDTDPDGDTLTVATLTSPTNGTATINPDGTVTYTPAPGYTGPDSFTYAVEDGNGGSATGTVTLTVDPVTGPALDGIVQGTPGDDLIDTAYTGDPQGDRIDNNDQILPGEERDDDIVRAFDGDDTVIAGPGNDDVFGGEGNDTVDGGPGHDLIDTSGNPRIDADIFPVDAATQPLDPFNTADEDPDPQNDLDTVDGGSGNDTIRTGDDADVISGGQGNDVIEPGIDDDSVQGNSGNDSIFDVQGADTIDGGSGNDTIIAGVDTFSDYVGDDPALPILGFTSDPNTDDGRDLIQGGVGNDLIQTGDDRDTIDGGQGDDTIDAGIDDDLIDGARGNDSIIASHGSDTVDGGQGDDYIDASNLAALEIVDAIDPVTINDLDSVTGGTGNDTILTGDDDDTIDGGQGDDSIDAGIDEDTVDGGAGNDTIIGGAGDDSLTGGADRDLFLGGNGGDFVDGSETGDDFDTLDLTGSAPTGGGLQITYTTPDREDGYVDYFNADGSDAGRLNFVEIENIVPCFTPGALIATPLGERLVEDLREGDRIITRDNGLQEIRWIGQKKLTGHQLARTPHMRPILILAGSLGNNMPEHDILVSPNHRVLVSNDKTALYFEETEVLVAAKHLTGLEGVDEVGALGVEYIHFMFDRHEVVLSNGAWTESFQPGDHSLQGIGNAQRNEIFELFPELETIEGVKDYAAARRSLKRHEAKLVI